MEETPTPTRRLAFDRGTLVLEGVSPAEGREAGLPDEWRWDSRVSKWRCDAIRYADSLAMLEKNWGRVQDNVPQWRSLTWPRLDVHPLRAEQQAAVAAWMDGRGRGVIVMPTGTGKTEVALAIMQHTALSTLIVAPVRDLMYQWHRRILGALGFDAGILGDNTYDLRPVSVTTYESAWIHMEEIGNRFGLIIFDECHHLPGRVRADAARMCAAPMRLGLTATPERSDGRHADLAWLVGPIVYSLSLPQVKGQTLADYEVFRIPVHLSDEEQSRYDALAEEVRSFMNLRVREQPDYSWENLCADAAADPASRRAQGAFHAKTSIEERAREKLRVLEDLFRLHAGEKIIVFTGSNAMARDVSLRFLVPCLLNHCRKRERLDILEGFRAGVYPAVVANQILDEGVDIPEAKVAVVLGGKTSAKQAKQRLGRVLRKKDNAKAVLYEVVCTETREAMRSRRRRQSDAYIGTRHRHL